MNKHYFNVCDCNTLTPVAKLVGMRLTASSGSQSNGQDIALVFSHSLMHWTGCSRVQMVAALEELAKEDILKSWRWVSVKDKFEGADTTTEALLVFLSEVDVDDLDIEGAGPEAISTEDIVGGDTSGLIKIDPRRARIFAKTEGKCFYCVEADAEHLDHMHPQSRGGSDADDNMIGACAPCNIRKNDRTVEEYRAYLAYRNRADSLSAIVFYGEKPGEAA